MEMMGLKPSFARKLNQNGFSPIHLALQNGHIELVRRLLQIDGDLVHVKGRERLTPLHYIVQSGKHHDLLEEFLLICPDSIADVTGRNEIALHIALKYNRLEVFKFLVTLLGVIVYKNAKFMGYRAATSRERRESGYLTRADTSRDSRYLARAATSKELRDSERRDSGYAALYEKYQRLPESSCFQFLETDFKREIKKLSEERHSMLLVVAALLVIVSYQVVLSPPDDGECFNATKVGSSPNGTVFLACNAIIFLISNSLIIFLVPNGYMKVLFFALNVTLCFSYSYAQLAIAGDPYRAYMAGILITISALFIFIAQIFFLEAMIRLRDNHWFGRKPFYDILDL
ncbi:ankyrin repeat-containing protein bda1 [Quercus suber]|uniref:Ankyrin repeat-containing protein bda1 n=1 Tax=Quercus suber TaxID=58331 RepID=A0AAW0LKR3_QUESU